MPAAGWYPDPAGSGGYRYWDGSGWSRDTRPTPPTGPGGPPGAPGPGGPGRRPRAGLAVLAMVAAIVVVAGVALAVIRPWQRPDDITDDPPTVTVSAGDDSDRSPSPPPSPSRTPTRTPTPGSSPSSGDPLQACPYDDPTARAAHPNDGRLHGGHLSVHRLPDYSDKEDSFIGGFTWMRDVALQNYLVADGWWSLSLVGGLSTAHGFTDPHAAAQAVSDCLASSVFYESIVGRDDVWSKPTAVDSYPGWWVRTRIHVSGYDVDGDVVDVIVVDTGDPDELSVYTGESTIDDQHTDQAIAGAIASLEVD